MRRWLVRSLLVCALAVGAAQAVTPIETTVLSESSYSVGEYTFTAVNVPTGYTVGYVKISRASWAAGSRIDWNIQLSQDGGSTWAVIAAGGAPGGVSIDPHTGLPRPYSLISAPLAQPENSNRKIRGTVTVSGDSATVTVYAGLF